MAYLWSDNAYRLIERVVLRRDGRRRRRLARSAARLSRDPRQYVADALRARDHETGSLRVPIRKVVRENARTKRAKRSKKNTGEHSIVYFVDILSVSINIYTS